MRYSSMEIVGSISIRGHQTSFQVEAVYDWEDILECGVNSDNLVVMRVKSEHPDVVLVRLLEANNKELKRHFYNSIDVNQLCDLCS